MNIALSAVILSILLLPGAAVIKAYYGSIKEKKSTIHLPFQELLLKGLVFSFVIHSAAICILRIFCDFVEFQLLYDIVIGKEIEISSISFTKAFLEFSLYNVTLVAFLFCLTKIFKIIIQWQNWDLDYYSLRNTNYWFQIFSARFLDMHNVQGERAQTDLIFLDILSNKDVLYSGFLLDFNYSSNKDQLENIVLHSARKRHVHKPTDNTNAIEPGRISHIPGDVFVIPAQTIENINIYYLSVEGEYVDETENQPARLPQNSTTGHSR